MFDQTPINRLNGVNWNRTMAAKDGRTDDDDLAGVRRLLADITELAELQMRLIADDARCLIASLVKPAMLGVIGLVIILGTMPVLLLAAASMMVEHLAWSPAVAQLTSGGAGLLVAAVLGLVAVKKLKACGSPLRQSLTEMEKNLATLREMLVGKDAVQESLERLERE
jgi:hypothetical protein